jgi:hypothetical protein
MSRLFGSMRQVGIVVRDIEAAMRHWVEVCGIGPWFYADRLAVTGYTYAGRRYDDTHISIALANSGDVQLELIQQRCNTPSMYRDFLAAGREGMQHWSSWPENYDEIYQRALATGYTVGQEGRHADADADFRCGPCRRGRVGRKRSDPPAVAELRSPARQSAKAYFPRNLAKSPIGSDLGSIGRAMVGFLPFDMSSKTLLNLPRSHLEEPDPLKQSLRLSALKSPAEAAGAMAKIPRQSAAIVKVAFIGLPLGVLGVNCQCSTRPQVDPLFRVEQATKAPTRAFSRWSIPPGLRVGAECPLRRMPLLSPRNHVCPPVLSTLHGN